MNIFDYSSYRLFVKDYIKASKVSSSRVTINSLAKKVGLTAPALQMILSGKRDLSIENRHKLAKALKLGEQEHPYFEVLVNFEQAKTPQTKSFYRAQLKDRRQSSTTYAKTSNQDLLSEWYMPVLLVYLMDQAYEPESEKLNIDFKKIEKHLGLSASVAQNYLQKLADLGVLEFRKKGQVHVIFEKINSYFSQRQYLHKVLRVMPKLLDTHFEDRSGFFEATTFSMNPGQLQSFRGEYKKLVSKYLDEAEGEKNRQIFQVLNCFVPVM
jgi:uncharacterized protein (TIGR02147 family)